MVNLKLKQKKTLNNKPLKILLIVPYITWDKDIRDHSGEPIGLLYLASYANKQIKKEGLNVQMKILDLQGEGENVCIKTKRGFRSGLDDENFIKILLDFKPDLVGVSSNYTNSVNDVFEICETVKKVLKSCLIVIGGAHATIDHENMIKNPNIDVIVRGEGEITFWELINNQYKNKRMKNVRGITFKENKKIIVNPPRPLIENLDTLPIPDRSLINFKDYYTRKRAITKTDRKIGNIVSSRGCPYNCIFCSTKVVWTNKWRPRSPENILEEIKYLNSKFGINEINFQDDQFIWDKERITKLCQLIIDSKLKLFLRTPPGLSPSRLDENLIELMAKAGFYEMTFSVDSGTPESIRYSRKPIDLTKIRALVKKANSLGIITTSTFVVGYPHEKEEDILNTAKYGYDLHTDYVNFYIAQPQIGSEYYDILKNLNRIDDKVHDMRDTSFGTDHITAERLMELIDKAMYGYSSYYFLNLFKDPVYFFKEFLPKTNSKKRLYQYSKLVIMWYSLHNIRRVIGSDRYFRLIRNIRNMLKNKRI